MGKVSIPLKLKFTLVILTLLFCSVAFYVFYAIDIFRKDKSADIYSSSLISANQLSKELNAFLRNNNKSLKRLVERPIDQNLVKSFFNEESYLFSLELFQKVNGNWKKELIEIDKSYISQYIKGSNNFEFENEGFEEVDSVNFYNESQVPGWTITSISQDKKKLIRARIKIDNLTQMVLATGENFKSRIVDYKGNSIVALDNVEFPKTENELVSFIGQGSKQLVRKVEDSLVAFVKIDDYPLIVQAFISEKKAFSAASELQKKSIYFGSLIFSIVVIVAILFARALTQNIQLLTKATERVALGEFETQINIKSNDEIGTLAKSFEYMGKEILRYIEEMKEKARLENEVKVAQLVQQTYFPVESEQFKNIETAYQFKPASECGGDWWGYFANDDKFVFLICDATGHGVPAALLTATASSSLSTLQKLGGKEVFRPSQLLGIFNSVVAELEGNINLTAIAGVLDVNSGELIYSNASHHPIWLLKANGAESFKESIVPLMGESGRRIGEDSSSVYVDHKIQMGENDKLLLLTDGILELENEESKAFGQRRLIKALETHSNLSLLELSGAIMKDAMDFSNNNNGDDITLAFVQWSKGSGKSSEKASPEDHIIYCCDNLKSIKLVPTPEQKFEVEFVGINQINSKQLKAIVLPEDLASVFSQENLILYSNKSNDENIELLKNYNLSHIVGENSPYLFEEINLALKGHKGDLIDIMRPYSEIKSVTVTRNESNSKIIEEFLNNNDFSEYFESPANYLHFMALELTNNVLMHSQENEANLSFIKSKNYVAIQVKDNVGKLNKDLIINSIYRGFKERTPKIDGKGAGLGLYMTYSHSNQFWVSLNPGKSTEIVCVIESNKRFKKYKERITSFHFIVRGNS